METLCDLAPLFQDTRITLQRRLHTHAYSSATHSGLVMELSIGVYQQMDFFF